MAGRKKKQAEAMEEKNNEVLLRKPIEVNGKHYEKIIVNRPSALDLLDFNLPALLSGHGREMTRLVKLCGEFEDGSPLPEDLELKIDLLDVISFGGVIMYFLRGMDLDVETPASSTSKKSSAKSSTTFTNTPQTSSSSASVS